MKFESAPVPGNPNSYFAIRIGSEVAVLNQEEALWAFTSFLLGLPVRHLRPIDGDESRRIEDLWVREAFPDTDEIKGCVTDRS